MVGLSSNGPKATMNATRRKWTVLFEMAGNANRQIGSTGITVPKFQGELPTMVPFGILQSYRVAQRRLKYLANCSSEQLNWISKLDSLGFLPQSRCKCIPQNLHTIVFLIKKYYCKNCPSHSKPSSRGRPDRDRIGALDPRAAVSAFPRM